MPHLSLAPDKVATAKGTSKLLLGTGTTLFTGKVLTKIVKKSQKKNGKSLKKKKSKKVKMKR